VLIYDAFQAESGFPIEQPFHDFLNEGLNEAAGNDMMLPHGKSAAFPAGIPRYPSRDLKNTPYASIIFGDHVLRQAIHTKRWHLRVHELSPRYHGCSMSVVHLAGGLGSGQRAFDLSDVIGRFCGVH